MLDHQRIAPLDSPGRAMGWLRAGFRKVRGRAARYAQASARRRDLRAVFRDARPHVLLVSNDLSRSGAPLLVYEIATLLVSDGYVPIVASPVDGPFAEKLRREGFRVLVDPSINAAPAWLIKLADYVRWTICNTIDSASVAAVVAPRSPTLWYLHEVSLLEERLCRPEVSMAINAVSLLWAGSALCANKLRDVRPDVEIVPYGVAPLGDPPTHSPSVPLQVGIFGSIERRKGQDLAVEAMAMLSEDERRLIVLTLYGRVLDPAFATPVLEQARALGTNYAGELDYEAYKAAIAGTDAVLVSSRDDTLPLVSIDALGLGRMLLLSPHVGTVDWLEPDVNVLVAPSDGSSGLVLLLRNALARIGDAPSIGAAAKHAFNLHFSRKAFHERLRAGYAVLELKP